MEECLVLISLMSNGYDGISKEERPNVELRFGDLDVFSKYFLK